MMSSHTTYLLKISTVVMSLKEKKYKYYVLLRKDFLFVDPLKGSPKTSVSQTYFENTGARTFSVLHSWNANFTKQTLSVGWFIFSSKERFQMKQIVIHSIAFKFLNDIGQILPWSVFTLIKHSLMLKLSFCLECQ